MTIEQLSKACSQVGAGYTVYFSPDNGTLIELATLEVVNGNAIVRPHYEEQNSENV